MVKKPPTGTSQAPLQTPHWQVVEEDVVNAAGQELEKSYRAAVQAWKTENAVAAGPATPALGKLESIQDMKTRLEEEKTRLKRENRVLELRVSDVAIIVRCLLSAWAFTVPLIQVKQTADLRGGATGTAGAGTTKAVNEIVLSNLPPVSAFC